MMELEGVSEAYGVLREKHDKYGRDWENCCVPYFQTEYDELLKLASLRPGSRVLDLGSPYGSKYSLLVDFRT